MDAARRMLRSRAPRFFSPQKSILLRSYDEVRLDLIARDAAANVAMISRYFGSKEGLFREVVKALIDPKQLTEGQRSTFGARMTEYIFTSGDTEQALDSIFLILRATMSSVALSIVRDVSSQYFAKPLAQWLGGEDAELRAHMIQSSLFGTIQARLVNKSLSRNGDITSIYSGAISRWLQEVVDGASRMEGWKSQSTVDPIQAREAGRTALAPPSLIRGDDLVLGDGPEDDDDSRAASALRDPYGDSAETSPPAFRLPRKKAGGGTRQPQRPRSSHPP